MINPQRTHDNRPASRPPMARSRWLVVRQLVAVALVVAAVATTVGMDPLPDGPLPDGSSMARPEAAPSAGAALTADAVPAEGAIPAAAEVEGDPFESVEIDVQAPEAPDEGTPDETSPNEASPDEASPDEASPDEASPNEASPAEASPSEEPCWCVGAERTITLPIEADFVIVEWEGDPDAELALRSNGPAGWSDEVTLSYEPVDGPDPVVGGEGTITADGPATFSAPPVSTGAGTTEVAIRVLSGEPTGVSVEALRSRYDRDDDPTTATLASLLDATPGSDGQLPASLVVPGAAPAELASVSSPASATLANTNPISQIGVIRRSTWGAQPWASWNPGCTPRPLAASGGVQIIVVHHTASNNVYSRGEAVNQVRSYQYWHQGNNRWCDIGYNFLVDRFGRLYEGREGSMNAAIIGAHAAGFNTRSVGIAMMGQFHPGALPTASSVSAEMLAGVQLMVSAVAQRWNINPAASTSYRPADPSLPLRSMPTLVGHRDVNATTCPGDIGYALLPQMRVNIPIATEVARNPVGSLDGARFVEPGKLRIRGWAADPDTRDPIAVRVFIDGTRVAARRANQPRPDVAAALSQFGPNHGFDTIIDVPTRPVSVCVRAVNVGRGTTNPRVGCRTVRPPDPASRNPVGAVNRVRFVAPGQVRVTGWAADPDSGRPIRVRVFADNRRVGTFVANGMRPDVAEALSWSGPRRGFDEVVTVGPGRTRVCVRAINESFGSHNPRLGCRVVDVPTGRPFGNLESVTRQSGGVQVTGWAIDPDTSDPVAVRVRVNGTLVATTTANLRRPDVAQAHRQWGPQRGYSVAVSAPRGATVCAVAANVGPGRNTVLGCQTV